MEDAPESSLPSTPESVKAVAQSNEGAGTEAAAPVSTGTPAGEGTAFTIGEGVTRAVEGGPYEHVSGKPIYRPLKIFALDPSVSKLEGATALVNVPYEPLEPGPAGSLFVVKGVPDTVEKPKEGEKPKKVEEPLNLEDDDILIRNGLDPSTSNERFHDQMVYAVCSVVYTAFRAALGRHLAWGFKKPADGRKQLVIRPRAFQRNESFYDKNAGEICFGFFKGDSKGGRFPGHVYACLSHDTVAHEVTHALLDGLRARFSLPTSQEVPAFHEGFADLVAVFQHFSYEQVVRAAIRQSRGNLTRADLLTDIARQLGQSGRDYKSALRSAIAYSEDSGEKTNDESKKTDDASNKADDESKKFGGRVKKQPLLFDDKMEIHDLGSVLVVAVFEAFINVFRRKTERLLRLATGGSGRLPPGEIPLDLQAALAEKASKLASQFLTMCIRAIDYCPPLDITFGEYLRAVITADRDLVPDDPWGYREAWIDAFRRHHIFPSSVQDLSEEALLWRGPEPPHEVPPIKGLTFAELKFNGDPALPANERELKRQARALGQIVSKHLVGFGLAAKGDVKLNGDEVELPVIESIRSSRRIGPSGQVLFDIVAEVTQLRRAGSGEKDSGKEGSGEVFNFYGGATVIIDPKGRIRYAMTKSVTNKNRLDEQRDFLNSLQGSDHREIFFGNPDDGKSFFMMLHENETPEGEDAGQTPTQPDGKAR
jgi:hypothetical protein